MKLITHIREQLGISQEYLAFLLGTNRGQLNMVERGVRHLSADGLHKILLMQKILDCTTPVTKLNKNQGLPLQLSEEIALLADWCETKGKYYQQMAEIIEIKNQQAQNCLSILPQLFADVPNNSENEKVLLTLKIITAESKKIINNYPIQLASTCRETGTALANIALQYKSS